MPKFDFWSPWEEMHRLRGEMTRLFERIGPRTAEFPPVNVWSNEEHVLVTAELPGMKSEAIDLSVLGDALTIQGSRPSEELKEGDIVHRSERGYGDFVRTVQLPYRVDPEKVEATYSKGVLRVTLARAEEDKPKKIALATK